MKREANRDIVLNIIDYMDEKYPNIAHYCDNKANTTNISYCLLNDIENELCSSEELSTLEIKLLNLLDLNKDKL